jgi:hypothetical protein
MRAPETVSRLQSFARRGPGTDAERRAASWLADELKAGGREVRLETFWCRPHWALAHAWHLALAIAGSLVSVSTPRVGGGLLVAALVFVLTDTFLGISPGRRLTPERASQNVVAAPRDQTSQVHLLLTANYDAGRTGLVYRDFLRRSAARLRHATRGLMPGWLGWISIAIACLLAIAILRIEGHKGTAIGIAQLVPTAALVLALALLLELASADYGPAAGDNGSGVGVAVALARALDAAPPRNLAIELIIQGAGEARGVGLRRHLRTRRRELRAANTIVLGIAPCSAGRPRWWTSDGPLIPLRYSRRLHHLCARIARDEPYLGAASHPGRGATPALPARVARLPAIALGCLDEHGLVSRSHQMGDLAAAVDPAALDSAVEFGLMLIDAIDAFVRETLSQRAAQAPA